MNMSINALILLQMLNRIQADFYVYITLLLYQESTSAKATVWFQTMGLGSTCTWVHISAITCQQQDCGQVTFHLSLQFLYL